MYKFNTIDNPEKLKRVVNDFKEWKKNDNLTSKKVRHLVEYFKSNNISAAVVGISGGLDSSVVLALLVEAAKVLRNEYNIDFSVAGECIVFDQYEYIFDGSHTETLYQRYGSLPDVHICTHNLSNTENAFHRGMHIDRNLSKNARANINYAMRYLALFAVAQWGMGLSDERIAVNVGTTNLDEMGYAGWFGKHSDMMVDIQPIADLHKFQVRQIAVELGVPKSIIDRAPTGDLISGETDEECFGCTYDELSLFTHYMTGNVNADIATKQFFDVHFAKVIKLHKQNAHKYRGQGWNPVFLKG